MMMVRTLSVGDDRHSIPWRWRSERIRLRIPSISAVHDARRNKAWRLRYVSRLNVCYWQERTHQFKMKLRKVSLVIALAAPVLSIAIYLIHREWFTITATACIPLAGALWALWKESADVRTAAFGYVRWSELASEAEALWHDGEECDWKRASLDENLARLDERDKFNESTELDPVDYTLARACHRCVNQYFQLMDQCNVEKSHRSHLNRYIPSHRCQRESSLTTNRLLRSVPLSPFHQRPRNRQRINELSCPEKTGSKLRLQGVVAWRHYHGQRIDRKTSANQKVARITRPKRRVTNTLRVQLLAKS